ncbi:MAG: hypothetical protein L6R39_002481 [Caloplaca ligustica]|nr:MAG: hypothetical protein L6R39_002481 [Caloplaca ligustica]
MLKLIGISRPPYNNIFEKIADKPRQVLRAATKYLGLFPPTDDVRILNDLLKDLHRHILGRSTTGTSFDYALVSFPSLPGLYEEDILDGLPAYGVLPETGWLTVTPYELYNHPHNAMAAFAASGFGLCANYTDAAACEEEESAMPEHWVYTLEYTNASIHARLSRMSVARLDYEPFNGEHAVTSFDLGYAAYESAPDKHAYWDEVWAFLFQLPQAFWDEGPITLLSFLGDCVWKHDAFVGIALEVSGIYQETLPFMSTADPEFAAAQGALKLARRWVARHGKGTGALSDGHFPVRGMRFLTPP